MQRSGFSVIEIIISSAIITATVVATMATFQTFLEVSRKSAERTSAALIAEEGGEIVQIIRDNGWTNYITPLVAGTEYYLNWNGTTFVTTTTPQTTNTNFVRKVVFSNVYRDGNSDISSSGTLDPETKKIGITISHTRATSTPILYVESLIHNTYAN